MSEATQLYAWKFIIGKDFVPLTSDPSTSFSSCLTVVIAPSALEARSAAARYAREFGVDARWLEVATVRRLDISETATLCWVMQ